MLSEGVIQYWSRKADSRDSVPSIAILFIVRSSEPFTIEMY